MECFACSSRPAARGALCVPCASGISMDARHGPGAIRSREPAGETSWLADPLGRLHPVGASARLGRHRTEIAIADVSVSREHALLFEEDGGFRIRDLGSRNGTFVGDNPVEGDAVVRPGDRVRVGRSAFLFLTGSPDPDAIDESGSTTMTTYRTERRHGYVIRVPDPVRLLMVEPQEGGSGVLMDGQRHVNLSLLQIAFVEKLIHRSVEDNELPEQVRGYTSSTILLEWLPWDAEVPDVTHLKQLVRRTRLLLQETRLTIEAARGLGYRVWSGGEARTAT